MARILKRLTQKKWSGEQWLLWILIWAVIWLFVYVEMYLIPKFSTNPATDNIASISAFATVLVVLVSLFTLVQNRQLSRESLELSRRALEESRRLWEKENRPLVVPYLAPGISASLVDDEGKPHAQCYDLCLKNYGPVPGINVSVEVDPRIPGEAILTRFAVPTKRARNYLGEAKVKDTIPIVKPGEEIIIAKIDREWIEQQLKKRTRYRIALQYRSIHGEIHRDAPVELDLVPRLPEFVGPTSNT